MYNDKAAGIATLLWMERGQIPNETSFRFSLTSSHLSRHTNVRAAVNEATRKMSGGSSAGRQPWVLCEGVIFEPAEIQMIDNHLASPTDTVRRYYADWG
jgi:hypothetical protein